MVEELTLRHRGSRSQQHRQELEGTDRRWGGHEVLLALERGPVGTGNSRARCGRLWHLRDTSVAQAAAGSSRDI